MQFDTLRFWLELIWVPIVGALIAIWTRISGLDTRAQLLERSDSNYIKQRDEDRANRDRERTEILHTVDRHHEIVMRKLESLEARIKNGH